MGNPLGVRVIGSINVDIVYGVDRLPTEHEKLRAVKCNVTGGGAAANTAYWLARLGFAVQMFGLIGNDFLGQFALRELKAAGVDVSQCLRVEGCHTNVASIFVNRDRKCMVTCGSSFEPRAYDFMLSTLEAATWHGVRHVHVASRERSLVSSVSGTLRRQAITSSIELNGMYDPDLVRSFDVVFSNHDELVWATNSTDPCAMLAERHAHDDTVFFVTKGAEGVLVVRRGQVNHIPTRSVEPIDRTGGGDAFDAGALFGYLRGYDPAACAAKGLALACAVIQGWGARPSSVDLTSIVELG